MSWIFPQIFCLQVIFPRYSLALFSSFSIPPHWSWLVRNLLQPIRSTFQIWVVTRHQFGISRLVSQTLFRGATSGGVGKSRLFSPATRSGLRSRRLELVGTRKHGPARRRHARGEGAPARKAPENRFPPPLQLPGSRCVSCQKFWQKMTDLAQTKRAAKKRCTFYLRSKYICYKDQLGYLIIERWSNKLMVNTQL